MTGVPEPGRAIAPLLEESLDDLYENAPCGYLSALADGTIVKVNQTFLDWTGFAREQLVGARRFQDLLTPGGQIYHETHYAPLLRMQGSIREIALQIRRSDGSRMPVLVNSVLRTALESEQTVVRTTVFDARDRRAYENELLHARRREAAAREGTERLQRLTEALAATLDERDVADATLRAAMETAGARAARIEVVSLDDERLVVLGSLGERGAEFSEQLDLLAGDRSLGRLRLELAERRSLTDEERAFLLACARQCAQGLERARLHAEAVQSARRAALLAELSGALEETRAYRGRAQRLADVLVGRLADEAVVEATDDQAGRKIVARAGSAAEGEGGVELVLRLRGHAPGALILRRRHPFGRTDRELLVEVADRAALALENARLFEHEHRVADALQRSMLTRRLPEHPRLEIAAYYQPAVELMAVGGDWYDAFYLHDGRMALVVGDVVGRGIEAASAMGQLRSAVRALAGSAGGPGELLLRLDDFVEHVEIARSATLAYAELDVATGMLRFACAGHPPPVLLDDDGHPALLWDGRSPPLGIPGIGQRPDAELCLAAGSRLLLYTDGLVERRDRPIDRGLEELLAAAREHAAVPVAALAERLPELLVPGHASRDDVCLLAVSLGAHPAAKPG